jgi:hypothetical protein
MSTLSKRYLGTQVDVLIKADLLTRPKDELPYYTTVVAVDGVTVLVKKQDSVKTLIELPTPAYDFQFMPVGNRIPSTATTIDATKDYRQGLSRDSVDGQLEPSTGVPTVMHGTFEASPTVTYKSGVGHVGSSSWFGSTDHVISWNGIGTMDGCGNDYRAYRELQLSQAYINPTYEPNYFHANDRSQPPDGTHLLGDKPYIRENPDNPPIKIMDRNTSVFRDGQFVYKATWPVLAACEVKVTEGGVDKFYLRVLCGRWFSPPEKFTPVQGDDAYFFEAYTLSGFYLYVQSATGWELKIIEIPALTAHPSYSTESFMAQAPHFSPDGSVAVGIIETGLGGVPNISQQFYEGKLVTKTQAWVFKIDVAAGTCTLTEPASTYTFTASGTNTSDSTSYSYVREQVLAVYPDSSSSIKKIVKTETLSTVKNITDNQKANAATTPVIAYGEEGTIQVANIQQLIMNRLGELQAAFFASRPLATAADMIGVTCNAQYPTSDNHETGNPSAYSYIPEPADTVVLCTFELSTGLITSNTTTLAAGWKSTDYGPSNLGICGKTSLTNPNQTTTVTKSVSINAFNTVVSTTPAVEVTTTGGQEVVMRGAGWIASAYAVGATVGFTPSIPIEIDRSWQANTAASSTTGSLTIESLVVVAADPRKGAAIVKNQTTNALSYVGISEPSGGF